MLILISKKIIEMLSLSYILFIQLLLFTNLAKKQFFYLDLIVKNLLFILTMSLNIINSINYFII